MNAVLDTIRTISTLQPGALPTIPAPLLPDAAARQAVNAVAQITGGSAEPLNRAVQSLETDQAGIDRVVAHAQQLCTYCVQDLVSLGLNLLKQALPFALGLVVPNPAVQAAARVALQGIAQQGLISALARIKQLVTELAQAATPLHAIAARAVESAFSDTGRAQVKSLDNQSIQLASASSSSSTATATGSSQGKAAVSAAMSQIGTPYVWGGTGAGGFDCSGLTQWAYRQAGIELPRLAQDQTVGRQVSAAELQEGDLIVWDGHVAMYAGGGQMVEAGDPVQTNPLRTTNMGMAFKGFWRPTG